MKPLQVIPDIKPTDREDRSDFEIWGIDKELAEVTKLRDFTLFYQKGLTKEEAVSVAEEAEVVKSREDLGALYVGVEHDEDGPYFAVHYRKRGNKFERIRRVTGYLSGDVSSFNNAKRSEEHDRVKHTL